MAWRQGLPYGQDLRDRVLASRDAGHSVRAVAERFSVSPSYVAKGRPAPAPHGGTADTTQPRASTGENRGVPPSPE